MHYIIGVLVVLSIFALPAINWSLQDVSAEESDLAQQPYQDLEALENPGTPLPLLKQPLEAPATTQSLASRLGDKLQALAAVGLLEDIEQKFESGLSLDESDKLALTNSLKWVGRLYRSGDYDTAAYVLDNSLSLFVESELIPGLLPGISTRLRLASDLNAGAMRLALSCGLAEEMVSLRGASLWQESPLKASFLELERDLRPYLANLNSPLARGLFSFINQKAVEALSKDFPEDFSECAREALRFTGIRQEAESGNAHSQASLGLLYCGQPMAVVNVLVQGSGLRE